MQDGFLGDASVRVDEHTLILVTHQHLCASATGEDDDGVGLDYALDLTHTHTHTNTLNSESDHVTQKFSLIVKIDSTKQLSVSHLEHVCHRTDTIEEATTSSKIHSSHTLGLKHPTNLQAPSFEPPPHTHALSGPIFQVPLVHGQNTQITPGHPSRVIPQLNTN